jgi:hypothetical protein
MMVPNGWENRDSVRFAAWANVGWWPVGPSYFANLTYDTLGCNYIEDFSFAPLGYQGNGLRKGGGVMSPTNTVIDSLRSVKQRIYYAEKYPEICEWPSMGWDNGYRWRYIDSLVSWDTIRYDVNDISPYAEFPQARGLVTKKFNTLRYHSGGDNVFYGNEGRTILGYNDNRDGNQLLSTWVYYPFQGTKPDTVKDFAAILEFNIDTADSSIDVDSATTTSRDSIPLVRLQIAFKNGADTVSQTILPYVPFKTPTNDTAAGWYLAVDTVITRAIYRTLKDSWRSPDVLNGNSASPSHSWTFKQLHVLLKPNTNISQLILSNARSYTKIVYGSGGTQPPLSNYLQQDDIVVGDLDSAGQANLKNTPLIEMEVLSTYRTTVRIRSLCWQDTTADKFFYRARFTDTVHHTDSSHSLNVDGSYGGYDDMIASVLYNIDTAVHGLQRGMFVDDFTDQTYLSASACGLVEYLGSKFGNLYVHIHEQDGGVWAQQFRRERMSHDGNPPNLFENEHTIFYSSQYGAHPDTDVFPLDYVYYGQGPHINYSSTWGTDANDSLFGLRIGRVDHTSDSLQAYRVYTYSYAGLADAFTKDRGECAAAQYHPKNKRYAIETGISGWGLNDIPGFPFKPDQRQTTPEETIAQTFGFIACGIGALNNAQACDFPVWGTPWGPGLFSSRERSASGPLGHGDDTMIVHDYNWGHHRRNDGPPPYPCTLPVDSDAAPGPTYLGYSNQFRAHVRVLQRINQIYPVYKYFTWRDAYCQHLSTNIANVDSISKKNSFLKIQYTQPVNRWQRNADRSYIDSTGVKDLPAETFVEVGLFDDSAKGNHAASS